MVICIPVLSLLMEIKITILVIKLAKLAIRHVANELIPFLPISELTYSFGFSINERLIVNAF